MTQIPDDGWDCRVALRGDWLWRGPRHRRAEQRLRAEVGLLAWLAEQLPLPVPAPELHSDEPLRVRHRLIPGAPWRSGHQDHEQGRQLGEFLAALHAIDVDEAIEYGARDADALAAEAQEQRDRFATEVVARLPHQDRAAALALLMRGVAADVPRCLVHADLCAEHVRTDTRIHGIIDWLDAGIGDPARDLAWPLYGTSPAFVTGFVETYPVAADTRARAADWFALAPWHGVLRALDLDDPQRTATALEAVSGRLRGAVARY